MWIFYRCLSLRRSDFKREKMTQMSVTTKLPKDCVLRPLFPWKVRQKDVIGSIKSPIYKLTLHQTQVKYIQSVVSAEIPCSPVSKLCIGNGKQPFLK